MNTAIDSRTSAGTPPRAWRRVVDAPVRMLHILSALCFAGAWLSAESEAWRGVHITLGYILAALIAFRLLYGLAGPRQARLSLWLRRTAVLRQSLQANSSALEWLKTLRQGLSPLLVILLLANIVPLTLSGYLCNNDVPEWLAELHELSANLMLTLVFAHIALVLLGSLLQRQNLLRPMLSGKMPGRGPDLAQRNHAWLAWLILAVAIGYGSYAWFDAPSRPALTFNQGDEHDESD